MPRKSKVKVTLYQRAPCLAFPYFACGFAFGHGTGTCFHVVAFDLAL